ncbi:FUSC family protein [Gordonia sp. LSe1-13]|uniref:FUSC family protein n=1 Tax=Gordonia sesuvii TaxID=3116777 RepID=A0ABU7MBL7_9ACTN|nr:FUSC family protein [Gordonia sp. LSe1-13]
MAGDVVGALRAHLHAHDPEHDALRRAVRSCAFIPATFAIAFYVVGGTQTPVFAVFGSFALLVFVDFPGDRRTRATSHLGLGVVGAVLITLGTALSGIAWAAVLAMFVVGSVVLFSGVVSAAFAAAGRSVLLTFVLPVAVPAPMGAVADRLLGWGLAVACCVPAALFVLAPVHHDRLRERAARSCLLLAEFVEGTGDAVAVRAAAADLEKSFLSGACRPVGLSAGSRALVRVVSELQWLTDRLTSARTSARGPSPTTRAALLRAAAATLNARTATDRDRSQSELETLVAELDVERDRWFNDFAETVDQHGASAVLESHAVDSAVIAAGRIIAWSGAADARPVLDRILGRRIPSVFADGRPAPTSLSSPNYLRGYLRWGSVSLRDSLRGGLGLAIAVGVTELFPVQHGFWIVLGTMSVLRSSALTTGSSVLRALVGTLLGFGLGAALLIAVGTGPVALWIALPPAVFLATYAPEVISFLAGQAAFTLVVVLLFNVIAPTGFEVGVIRVEDVAIGAAVAAVVSLALWPRNPMIALRRQRAEAAGSVADLLAAAVRRVTRHRPVEAGLEVDASRTIRTFEDDVRRYLTDRGGTPDDIDAVMASSSRMLRTMLAAERIAQIPLRGSSTSDTAVRDALEQHATSVGARLDGDPGGRISASVAADVLDARTTPTVPSDLLWAAAYLNDLEQMWRHPTPAAPHSPGP